MANYINTALDRIELMQKAAITKKDGSELETYDYPFVKTANHPYWVTWTGPFETESESADTEIRVHEFTMRLVMGHATEGYEGELPRYLNDYIVDVLDYFNSRPTLRRTHDDERIPYMHPGGAAVIGDGTGISVTEIDKKVVCDFKLTVPFMVPLTHVY